MKQIKRELPVWKGNVFLLITAMGLSLLSGCGSQSPSAQSAAESTGAASSIASTGASSQAASESDSKTAGTEKNITLGNAEKERGGRAIQEDDSYIYICANSQLNRYDKKNPDSSFNVFKCENSSDSILSYYVDNNQVYMLVNTNHSTDTRLLVIHKDGSQEVLQDLKDKEYSQVCVYKNVLYLTGYFDKVKYLAYDLKEDGTIAGENTDLNTIISKLPQDATVISSYSDTATYYDVPYCVAVYGKIYLMNSNSQLLTADPSDSASLASPKVLGKNIPGAVYGMTDKYLISVDTYSKGGAFWTCYTTDLSTGASNAFATIDQINSSSTYLDQVLGYDENGIYLGITNTGTSSANPQPVYQIRYYSFADGKETDLCSFKPEASTNITYGCFASGAYGFLSNGFYYVRSVDYKNIAFTRSYQNMSKETTLGGSPFFDSGLSKAGIKLNLTEYTKYAGDDPSAQELLHIKMTVPQFAGSGSAAQKMNSFFASAAEKSAKEMTDRAQKDYQAYLSTVSSASSASDASDDAAASYSGFPYDLSSLLLGITYQDDNYICLETGISVYTGGAHGSNSDYYYLMDKKTGKQLSLDDVIKTDHFKKLVLKYLKETISASPGTFFPEALSEVNKDYTDHNFNFFLTDKGIGIEFGEYEVAPYAAGAQSIIIPYHEVTMKINLSKTVSGNAS